ncbi:unnamed protein product, partial [Adineta ricciae]
PASYAQCRIWLNEETNRKNVTSEMTINNKLFLYEINKNVKISLKRLNEVLELIIEKHEILRTSIKFDKETNELKQYINESNKKSFELLKSIYETNDEIERIINEEKYSNKLFNLNEGLVFRCHIIYYREIGENELIKPKDLIIFNFHKISFDNLSIEIFLNDLNEFYYESTTKDHWKNNIKNILRYIDYSIIEKQISMNEASKYWLNYFENSNLNKILSFPYD